MSKVTIVTPKVTFQHVNLSRPDRQYRNYKTKGYFSSKDDAMVIVDALKGVLTAVGREEDKITFKDTQRKAGDKRMHIGGIPVPVYKDTDEQLYVEARSNYAPNLFDVTGRPYPEDDIPMVGPGSTGKIKIQFKWQEKYSQIGSYLLEAQIIGFKSYRTEGFGDASSEVEDDEISSPEATEPPQFEMDDDNEGDDAVSVVVEDEDDTDW